jgi:DNA-binding NarL/FixJ family response regulator
VHDDDEAFGAVLSHLTSIGMWLPMIAFSENPGSRQVARAMRAGALGYLDYPFTRDEYFEAVDLATSEASIVGKIKIQEAKARGKLNRLTRREQDVLVGMADGLSNREIGDLLGISWRTVEIHRANLLDRLRLSHSAQAIRIAVESQLVY